MIRRIALGFAALLVVAALFVAVRIGFELRGGADAAPSGSQVAGMPADAPGQVERGRYLALAGNCAGCHSARGGAPYAGGLGIATPFGTVYASNLTPDARHGIGQWSAADFWRAMHHGRSKDGRLLYPAFPYPEFTRVTREDSDAIHAYLRTVEPSGTPDVPHTVRFPFDTQVALAAWRILFFEPGTFMADPAKTAEWNRGAYLADGLGHCIACHGPRNSFGATETRRGLSGGVIPAENWYAPSLLSTREAGVADWAVEQVVQLLGTGTAPRGSVIGPMADVVFRSTQHLSEADLRAMAVYLRDLPAPADRVAADASPTSPTPRRDAGTMVRGERIYDQRCAYCHGDAGQGVPGAYPALAGSRAVGMPTPLNLIQIVRRGGFLPTTRGNPRPFGMPPFGHVLDDNDIAAVLTYVRGSWGNDAPAVTPRDTMPR